MAKTIVATYDSESIALQVVQALVESGIQRHDIGIMPLSPNGTCQSCFQVSAWAIGKWAKDAVRVMREFEPVRIDEHPGTRFDAERYGLTSIAPVRWPSHDLAG